MSANYVILDLRFSSYYFSTPIGLVVRSRKALLLSEVWGMNCIISSFNEKHPLWSREYGNEGSLWIFWAFDLNLLACKSQFNYIEVMHFQSEAI